MRHLYVAAATNSHSITVSSVPSATGTRRCCLKRPHYSRARILACGSGTLRCSCRLAPYCVFTVYLWFAYRMCMLHAYVWCVSLMCMLDMRGWCNILYAYLMRQVTCANWPRCSVDAYSRCAHFTCELHMLLWRCVSCVYFKFLYMIGKLTPTPHVHV